MNTSKSIISKTTLKTRLLAVLVASGVSISSHAQDTQDQLSGFYLAPALGYLSHSREDHGAKDDYSASLSLGYQWASAWAAEFAYTRSNPESEFGDFDIDSEQFRLDAFYHLSDDPKLKPYLVFGAGESQLSADAGSFEETLYNAGLGIKYAFNDAVSLRSDIRALRGVESGTTETAVNLGLHFLLGGKSSAKKAAPVKALDTDSDGVTDQNDQCANTPSGVSVDQKGCPIVLDNDKDGIPDSSDKCPDTEKGAAVNSEGCYKTLSENVAFALNINFANNSDAVISENLSDIKALAMFMTSYPQSSVTIEGHTDSSGAASYNKALSQKRAEAVRQLLIDRYGVDANRLDAVGFGEEKPVASNDTSEGRAKNRRVEAQAKATIEKVIK